MPFVTPWDTLPAANATERRAIFFSLARDPAAEGPDVPFHGRRTPKLLVSLSSSRSAGILTSATHGSGGLVEESKYLSGLVQLRAPTTTTAALLQLLYSLDVVDLFDPFFVRHCALFSLLRR